MTVAKKNHTDEHLRKKIFQRGTDCLTNTELLTLVLSAEENPSTAELDLSKAILKKANHSLRKLGRLSRCDICRTKKTGFVETTKIIALFELARRYGSEEDQRKIKLDNPESIFKYFRLKFLDYPQEVFTVLLFDIQQRLTETVRVSFGGLAATALNPREVFAPAIASRAASLVILHNHPSGDPTPSTADRAITDKIVAGGEILGIPVLDHIIIGSKEFFSFREQDLIS